MKTHKESNEQNVLHKVKTEACKEFAAKLTKRLDPTLIAVTMIGCVLIEVEKSRITEKEAINKIKKCIENLEIDTRLSFDMAIMDILDEMSATTTKQLTEV